MLVLGLVEVPVWLIFTLACVVLLYLLGTRTHGAFKGTGIAGPKPWPFLGTTPEAIIQGFMTYDPWLKETYGKVVGVFSGTTPALVVFDYEMISQVTVKQFNNFTNRRSFNTGDPIISDMVSQIEEEWRWKHVRSTMSPAFTTGKLRRMTAEMNRCAKDLVDNMASGDQPFEARKYSGAYTMDVIASAAFGLRVNSQVEKDNAFVTQATKIMNIGFRNPIILCMFVAPKLARVFTQLGYSFLDKDGVKFFTHVIEQTIEARQEGDETRSDFIQMMANAQHGGETYDKEDEDEVEKHATNTTKVGLTKGEVVANALVFFLAGFDTTALGLTQLMYCLACNPDCQEKVIAEIDRILGDETDVDYDSVMKMQYLDQCLQECMRLYPASPRTDRIAKEDTVVGGIKVPKGMIVNIPIYALQHDPETWPDPEKFDPDRFSQEEKAKRNPITWLPFGYGPRNCIGLRLALYEMKVAIVHILRTHRLVTCDKTEQPLAFSKDKWMTAKNGVWLALEKLDKKSND